MNAAPDHISIGGMSDCAEKLKVLADATRFAVVQRLLFGSCHVGDLMDELGIEQSLLSHHLKVLREAGIVAAERDGKAVLYSLASGIEGPSSGSGINLECCHLNFDMPKPKRKRSR